MIDTDAQDAGGGRGSPPPAAAAPPPGPRSRRPAQERRHASSAAKIAAEKASIRRPSRALATMAASPRATWSLRRPRPAARALSSVDQRAAGRRPADRAPTGIVATDRSSACRCRACARVAERLVSPQSTAAILTTFNEVDMEPVMDLRNRYKDKLREGARREARLHVLLREGGGGGAEEIPGGQRVDRRQRHRLPRLLRHRHRGGAPRGLVVPICATPTSCRSPTSRRRSPTSASARKTASSRSRNSPAARSRSPTAARSARCSPRRSSTRRRARSSACTRPRSARWSRTARS